MRSVSGRNAQFRRFRGSARYRQKPRPPTRPESDQPRDERLTGLADPLRGARRPPRCEPRRTAPRLSATAAGDASRHRRHAQRAFQAVQHAWELVGDPDDRARYDRGESITVDAVAGDSAAGGFSATVHTARPAPGGATVRARSYGHPGGRSRERFLAPDARVDGPRHRRLATRTTLRSSAPPRARSGSCSRRRSPRRRRRVPSPGSASASRSGTTWPCIPRPTRSSTTSCSGRPDCSRSAPPTGAAPVKLAKGEIVGAGIGPDEEPFHDLLPRVEELRPPGGGAVHRSDRRRPGQRPRRPVRRGPPGPARGCACWCAARCCRGSSATGRTPPGARASTARSSCARGCRRAVRFV